MSRTGAPEPLSMRSLSRRTSGALLEAKLHSTPVREDWVVRRRLVDQLDQAGDRPVVLVAAPAGFGKTTLLAQWLATGPVPRTTAWVTSGRRGRRPGAALDLPGHRARAGRMSAGD